MCPELLVEEWEPRPIDMIWAVGLIRGIRHNGLWHVPRNGAVYRVDHEHKTLWLIHGDEDDVFEKNKILFNMLGWRVLRQDAEAGFSA